MPWRERSVMEEREEFVRLALKSAGEVDRRPASARSAARG